MNMDLTTLLTGGFMRGYRTILIGLGIALQAIISWAVGDTTIAEIPWLEILGGFGLVTLRAGIHNDLNEV